MKVLSITAIALAAIALSGCASTAAPAVTAARVAVPSVAASAPNDFCSEYKAGGAAYLDFVTSDLTPSVDLDKFKNDVAPYIAKLRAIAPAVVSSSLDDYASIADQISAVLAAGGGSLNLDTTRYQPGILALGSYCS